MPEGEALERIGRHLHWTMERLDPSDEDEDWEALKPFQQEFYRACVREVVAEYGAVQAAAGNSPVTTK